jgi:hypothetical protein
MLGWLTAGYPDGIPATDRFAVVALLRRRLTDQQIHEIAEALTGPDSKLASEGYISGAEIEDLTRRVMSEPPSPEEIARVSARLAAAGWPLEGTV